MADTNRHSSDAAVTAAATPSAPPPGLPRLRPPPLPPPPPSPSSLPCCSCCASSLRALLYIQPTSEMAVGPLTVREAGSLSIAAAAAAADGRRAHLAAIICSIHTTSSAIIADCTLRPQSCAVGGVDPLRLTHIRQHHSHSSPHIVASHRMTSTEWHITSTATAHNYASLPTTPRSQQQRIGANIPHLPS